VLPQVEFPYNATHALGIVHIPFEAYFGFSLEEPSYGLFTMRPSISVSQDATGRLKQLRELQYARSYNRTYMSCKVVQNRR
jgi:hypothetical protein